MKKSKSSLFNKFRQMKTIMPTATQHQQYGVVSKLNNSVARWNQLSFIWLLLLFVPQKNILLIHVNLYE